MKKLLLLVFIVYGNSILAQNQFVSDFKAEYLINSLHEENDGVVDFYYDVNDSFYFINNPSIITGFTSMLLIPDLNRAVIQNIDLGVEHYEAGELDEFEEVKIVQFRKYREADSGCTEYIGSDESIIIGFDDSNQVNMINFLQSFCFLEGLGLRLEGLPKGLIKYIKMDGNILVELQSNRTETVTINNLQFGIIEEK